MTVADVEATPPEEDLPSPEQPDSPAPGGPHLPYFPALDGIRGIAVLAVLCFHGGFSWAVGGYLGVSTFFTLSGFLITSLLLAERAHNGRVNLKAFWVRRFRRLLPASLVALTFVLIFGVVVADAVQRRNLAGDVVACLAYVANWRFILTGQSYADLFAGPSPVLHFWSLAIEEQFYLVFPLLIGGILALGGLSSRTRNEKRSYWLRQAGQRYRAVIAAVLVALALGSLALTLFGGLDHNHIYLGTFTRAGELLIGGILASLLFDARVTARIARRGLVRTAVAVAGCIALAVVVVLWIRTPEESTWLYRGGLTLYALLSATIVTAAILPIGPVSRGLAIGPLRRLGQISYGVYLFHWPVFLWLRQATSWAMWPRFVVGVAVAVVMAELSFRYLETPIRKGQKVLRFRPVWVAPFAMGAIAAAAVFLTATAPKPLIDFAAAQEGLSQFTSAAPPPPSTTIDPASLVPPTPRIAFFGDSTALTTGYGMAIHFRNTGDAIPVQGFSGLGCSFISLPERRVDGKIEKTAKGCNEWEDTYRQLIAANKPDVAVVQSGPWDISDRQLPGDSEWVGPGDPGFDQYLLGRMETAVDILTAEGGVVVWLTDPGQGIANPPDRTDGYDEPARVQRYNELVNELTKTRPGKVLVVDLAKWVHDQGQDDARLRPDGVHFGDDTTPDGQKLQVEVADKFLANAVLTAYRDDWIAKRRAALGQPEAVQSLFVGDASSLALADGVSDWAKNDRSLLVRSIGQANCGIARFGQRMDKGRAEPVPDECNHWDSLYPIALAGQPTDLAVVSSSVWDVTDRKLDDWSEFKSIGDEAYDDYMREEIGKAADLLHSNGAQVAWLTAPHIDWGRADSPPPATAYPASDPARIDRLNELIREVAEPRPWMHVVDYADFASTWPGGDLDPAYRPDGVSPSPDGARRIADWLGPELVALARTTPSSTSSSTSTTN